MVSSGLQKVLGTREVHNSHCKEMPGVGGRWSPNSTVKVYSYLDCHAEIHCHLQLFLVPSVFNLVLIYDLSEVPLGGLQLHAIPLAGLARLFPIGMYLWLRS